MENLAELRSRCAAAVARLDRERGWAMDEHERASSIDALVPCLSPDCSDEAIVVRVEHYRLDHRLVRALRDNDHPGHADAWAGWVDQAMRIVRSRYPGAPELSVAETHDLAQEGLAALSQALPSYRYQSRFSTWAYSVVMRTVYRKMRDLHAAKRAADREAVELQADQDVPPAVQDDLEDIVAARVLARTAEAILCAHPDDRLALIFRLWAIDDQPSVVIARRLNLSVSRVNSLLADIRELLRAHPQIASWRADRAASSLEEPASGSGGGTS